MPNRFWGCLCIYFCIFPASAQWQQSITPNLGFYPVIDISFGDSSTVCVLNIQSLYVSRDKGHSFEKKRDFSPPLFIRLQVLDDNTYIVSNGAGSDQRFMKTSNGGNTWSNLYMKSTEGDTIKPDLIHFFYFWENGHAVVVSPKQGSDSCDNVYLSEDFGESWSRLDCSKVTITALSSNSGRMRLPKYAFEDRLLLAHPSDNYRFLVLSDYGNRIEEYEWDSMQFFGYAFRDSLNGLVTNGNSIYKTTDGGKTITQVASTSKTTPHLSYASATTSRPQDFYIAVGNGFHVSKDKGASWENIDEHGYSFIQFKNSEYGIAAIQNDQNEIDIYYFTEFPSNVKQLSTNGVSVYPNPAQTELFVEEIPAGAEYKILNTIGAEVAKGIFEGGSVPVSRLSQGVYLLQIQTREQMYQARFVKE